MCSGGSDPEDIWISGLSCDSGYFACFAEIGGPGTARCDTNTVIWSAYTNAANSLYEENTDVCNSLSTSEGTYCEIRWGWNCPGKVSGNFDANRRECVYSCYYDQSGGMSGQTFNINSQGSVDTLAVGSEIEGSTNIGDVSTTATGTPLRWKAVTFDGTNRFIDCSNPPDGVIDNCLIGITWPSDMANAVCESAGCGAASQCDERHPNTLLTPYSCTIYGASYLADGCTPDCLLGDDISACRSSAFASGCTASADCNGVVPNTDITKCTNGNAYFADKCTSTCSAVDRGDNVCRSSAFASGCTAAGSCNGLTPGTNINSCNNGGQTYFADKCNSGCGVEDRDSICRSSAFASGCTALAECNGLTPGTNINTCNKGGQTYFADKCSSTCGGQDRDNVCRSSAFASGCTATSQCNGKSPGSDGSNDWECNSLGDPSTSANQQCWCSGTCGVVNDGCESKYGSSAACDEKSPGEDLPSCSLAGRTYFADECGTGDCLLKDKDNICRSSTFASDCIADSQCNGVAAGSGSCDSSCHYMPGCTCSAWEPTFDCCGSQMNKKERWIRTCTPSGCSYESKCEGYCFI
jgi:hypothetical protein